MATFPMLRPASASILSIDRDDSSTTGSSSMSSHVRRAIQTALELEAVDRAGPAEEPQRDSTVQGPSPVQESSPVGTPTRTAPISQISPDDTVHPVPVVMRVPTTPTSPGVQGRQPSKLAMLAQAKAQQGHWTLKAKKASAVPSNSALSLHKSHTEYLAPIANGPTATTAITTSYQTFGSLLSSAQSALPPSVLPSAKTGDALAPKPGRVIAESRQSKLAMKSKSAQRKPEPEPIAAQSSIGHPLFSSKATRTRALPSAFASLLIDDIPVLTSEDKSGASKGKGRRDGMRTKEHPTASVPSREKPDIPKRSTHRERKRLPPSPPLSPLRGFAFDIPSPDDVVFNARRGTLLAPRSGSTTSYLPRSTPSAASSISRSSVDAVV